MHPQEVEHKNQFCRSAKMGSPWQAGPVHSSGGLRRDRNFRDTPKRCGTATGGPHTAALSGSQAVPIARSFIHPLRGHISRVMLQEQEGRRWSLPSRDPQSSRRQGTRQSPQPRAPPVYRMIRSCRAFWKRGGKLVHVRSTGWPTMARALPSWPCRSPFLKRSQDTERGQVDPGSREGRGGVDTRWQALLRG